MSSQVKNLRAMFENKGDASPPDDRGRASGVSTPTPSLAGANGSPRPLSKVRTNFVAIEKDGRIGLRRDPSGESVVSRRRMSNETDAESTSTFPDKPSTVSTEEAPKPATKQIAVESPPEPREMTPEPRKITPEPRKVTPEPRKITPDATSLFGGEVGAVSDKPSTNPDKKMDQELPTVSLTAATPTTNKPLPDVSIPVLQPTQSNGEEATDRKVDKVKDAAPSTASPKITQKAKPVAIKTSTPPVKSGPKSPIKPAIAKPAAETPRKAVSKPPAKAAERPAAEKPAAERLAAKKEVLAIAKTAATAPRPTPVTPTATRKPQPIKTAGHNTSSIKPKSKSPTKPASLPHSLSAPTASSVSKGSTSRQSLSRQSNHRPSHNVVSQASTLSAQSSTRQGSSASRSRPSLGPPPAKPTEEPKKHGHVDESFLARMMRPTQASSSKTTEKAQLTPPRKLAARPSTTMTNRSTQREPSVAASVRARRTVSSKTPESTQHKKAASEGKPALETAVSELVEKNLPKAQEMDVSQTTVSDSESHHELSKETRSETVDSKNAEQTPAVVESGLAQLPTDSEKAEQTMAIIESGLAQPPADSENAEQAPVSVESDLNQPPVDSKKTEQTTVAVENEVAQPPVELIPTTSEHSAALDSVEVIIPETAKVETSEEAIAVAKEANLIQALPINEEPEPVKSDEVEMPNLTVPVLDTDSSTAVSEAPQDGPSDVDMEDSQDSPDSKEVNGSAAPVAESEKSSEEGGKLESLESLNVSMSELAIVDGKSNS